MRKSRLETAAAQHAAQARQRPQNVGILGMEIYFPPTYVDQRDLEKYDQVGEGKYTIGLGQTAMSFV